jgi:hypothetical protein
MIARTWKTRCSPSRWPLWMISNRTRTTMGCTGAPRRQSVTSGARGTTNTWGAIAGSCRYRLHLHIKRHADVLIGHPMTARARLGPDPLGDDRQAHADRPQRGIAGWRRAGGRSAELRGVLAGADARNRTARSSTCPRRAVLNKILATSAAAEAAADARCDLSPTTVQTRPMETDASQTRRSARCSGRIRTCDSRFRKSCDRASQGYYVRLRLRRGRRRLP